MFVGSNTEINENKDTINSDGMFFTLEKRACKGKNNLACHYLPVLVISATESDSWKALSALITGAYEVNMKWILG